MARDSDQGGLIIPDIHLNADDAGAAHGLPLRSVKRKDAAIVPDQAVAHQVGALRAVGIAGDGVFRYAGRGGKHPAVDRDRIA